MLVSRTRRSRGFLAIYLIGGSLVAFASLASDAFAQTLVGNPFITPDTGWVDAFPTTRAGNWRLSLHNPTLMDTNNANPPTSGATTNDGTYEPDVMFQNNFLTPANYEYTVAMRQNDDDIIGLVWNYQDPNNYFRVGIRQQAAGSFGGTEGLSVQKIVNGTLTQLIPSVIGPGPASPITQTMIDNRDPITMKVAVTGSNYEIFFNNVSVGSGTDAALVAGRKVGVQSWAEQADVSTVTPYWGAEFESATVTQGANTLFTQTFDSRPVKWRQLVMSNTDGVNGLTVGDSHEVLGNFGNTVGHSWIHQQSNGFQYATATTPNVDFIGPAVVVDEAGSAAFTNYEMRARLGAVDNDGIGVLVRVQDDNNFYRINFVNEGDAGGAIRARPGCRSKRSATACGPKFIGKPARRCLHIRPVPATRIHPAFPCST